MTTTTTTTRQPQIESPEQPRHRQRHFHHGQLLPDAARRPSAEGRESHHAHHHRTAASVSFSFSVSFSVSVSRRQPPLRHEIQRVSEVQRVSMEGVGTHPDRRASRDGMPIYHGDVAGAAHHVARQMARRGRRQAQGLVDAGAQVGEERRQRARRVLVPDVLLPRERAVDLGPQARQPGGVVRQVEEDGGEAAGRGLRPCYHEENAFAGKVAGRVALACLGVLAVEEVREHVARGGGFFGFFGGILLTTFFELAETKGPELYVVVVGWAAEIRAQGRLEEYAAKGFGEGVVAQLGGGGLMLASLLSLVSVGVATTRSIFYFFCTRRGDVVLTYRVPTPCCLGNQIHHGAIRCRRDKSKGRSVA